jgi:enamine deaminase RidA (YjgF/YER057c/UK114 family)
VNVRRFFAIAIALLGSVPVVAVAQASFDPEARLRELKLELPTPVTPVANYVRAVRTGNLVFLAGHGECGPGKYFGKIPRDRTIEEGYDAARNVGLCLLASLKAEIGDLRKVKRIVRVFGMVNATEDFTQQPKVINGCSDMLVAVLGDRGRHARAAVGMQSLPNSISVEIEIVVEVNEGSP